jgi:hypothetical protein
MPSLWEFTVAAVVLRTWLRLAYHSVIAFLVSIAPP